jgi:hypothetical protein
MGRGLSRKRRKRRETPAWSGSTRESVRAGCPRRRRTSRGPDKNTYLGVLYHRLAARRGKKRAALAVAQPEDMASMMNAIMDRMFRGMTTDDRIRFVTTMMPKCLGMVMAEMPREERQKLAREMVGSCSSTIS